MAVYTLQILLFLLLGGVCFAAKRKRKNGTDYHNIEFVDIESAPMVSYNEFRPQSQSDTDNIEPALHETDEDDSDQQNADNKPAANATPNDR